MKLLIKKEWKLTVTPVPLLFLLLSALVLVPSYPYYVTFFYNALGIFLMLQAARENRDVYYMALLPLTKRDLVRARFSTIVTLQLLQALVCVPFMRLRMTSPAKPSRLREAVAGSGTKYADMAAS